MNIHVPRIGGYWAPKGFIRIRVIDGRRLFKPIYRWHYYPTTGEPK